MKPEPRIAVPIIAFFYLPLVALRNPFSWPPKKISRHTTFRRTTCANKTYDQPQLIGICTARSGERMALVAHDNATHPVSVGDTISDSISVQVIADDHVIVNQHGQTIQLSWPHIKEPHDPLPIQADHPPPVSDVPHISRGECIT